MFPTKPQSIAAVLLGVFLLVSGVGAQKLVPEEGQPFPDLVFPLLGSTPGDQPKSLASFRGKKLLLIQFASW